MAKELYAIPFSTLVERLKKEINGDSIYALPRRSWWRPQENVDISYHHFGMKVGTPLGPASGPHTQLAQNLVLAWLGGARFMELKTVQVLDELEIQKHCIHVPHIGYNIEWSQELQIADSIREYVKGWYLLYLLTSDRGSGLWDEMDAIFDISVGYDLAGIKSEKVDQYLRTMKDASKVIEELRESLPEELREWADIKVPSNICNSVTISTFHGCPVDEIEEIATHLMEHHGLNTILKLKPTLLGYEKVRKIINDELGYEQITLDPKNFEKDLSWTQLLEMLPRLQDIAKKNNVGIGVKFTNTLVVKSDEPSFDNSEEIYLSGPPLHVIALSLAEQFSQEMGSTYPMTFSAGVDAQNFTDLIAAGIGPVTASSDILKVRGYGRLHRYLRNLEEDMEEMGAKDINAYRVALGGLDDPKESARAYLTKLCKFICKDPRYHRDNNRQPPKKIGSHLKLFNCLTCNKCVPVCPNAANFTFPIPKGSHQLGYLTWDKEKWTLSEGKTLIINRRHQIGTTVDVCNLCGHCDTWCPEDGGPYLEKPNLFLSQKAFDEHPERDGFLVGKDFLSIQWRHNGEIYQYSLDKEGLKTRFELPNKAVVELENGKPIHTSGKGAIDLSIAMSMELILKGVTSPDAETWLPSSSLYAWQWNNQ